MDETNVQKQISTGSESNSEDNNKNDSKYSNIIVLHILVFSEEWNKDVIFTLIIS